MASYEHVRHAVRYLRWDHRDSDQYAPSVRTRRQHIQVIASLIEDGKQTVDRLRAHQLATHGGSRINAVYRTRTRRGAR